MEQIQKNSVCSTAQVSILLSWLIIVIYLKKFQNGLQSFNFESKEIFFLHRDATFLLDFNIQLAVYTDFNVDTC